MYYLGIDLGGTNIAVGVLDRNYKIISKSICKTLVPRTEIQICKDMFDLCTDALSKASLTLKDISFIGIGAPGSVDSEKGVVEFSSNLRIKNWNLREMMESMARKPVRVENDANAALYGEYVSGAAKGCESAIMVTLGTGIGGGMMVDGEIIKGVNFNAGEIGHMVIVHDGVKCTCGRRGCFERYASASGLKYLTKKILLMNPQSIIWQHIDNDLNNISGRTAFECMREGDLVAKIIVDKYISYLACGITNLVNIFQPDLVCIGGGISNEGSALLDPIKKIVEKERYSRYSKKQTQVKLAKLGNEAGIVGAATLSDSL